MNVLHRSLRVTVNSRFYRQISVNMNRRTQIKKVLCVAEKNDAAKGISEIMSNGRSRRVSVYSHTVMFMCNVRPYGYQRVVPVIN